MYPLNKIAEYILKGETHKALKTINKLPKSERRDIFKAGELRTLFSDACVFIRLSLRALPQKEVRHIKKIPKEISGDPLLLGSRYLLIMDENAEVRIFLWEEGEK